MQYRDSYKFWSTYIKGLERQLGADRRIHASFNIAGTVSGRLSSSGPNLQNIPSRDKEQKKAIRDAFIADEGKVWVDTDFSQIEMRVIAVLSQDPWLIQCYKDGRDMHAEMAEMAFGPGWTKEHRYLAKGLNFGLAYGRTVGGILKDGSLSMSVEDAERVAKSFYERMPQVRVFQEKVKQFVFTYGFVDTPLGRTRSFPSALLAQSDYEKASIFNEAFNTVIQSTASDITLYSIVKLHQAGLDPRITVHDSIAIQVPEDKIAESVKQMAEIMEGCGRELLGDDIPWPVEAEVGKRWGSLIVERE
jgi:DNA polymerase-1